MNIILFDVRSNWENLLPLTFTKPIPLLRVGFQTLHAKWEKHLQQKVYIEAVDELAPFFECEVSDDNLFINSAYVPDQLLVTVLQRIAPGEYIFLGDELLACRGKSRDNFDPELDFPVEFVPNKIKNCGDILRFTPRQFTVDLDHYKLRKRFIDSAPANTTFYEEKNIFVERGAILKSCVINAEEGPVLIRKGAQILENAVIKGPCYIGPNTVVAPTTILRGGCIIGDNSYVGGELKNVMFLGNSNKAHAGYLGDSIVGEFCNLGSLTNGSNLKNNYSEVSSWSYVSKAFEPSGRQKLGSIISDYVHCGINTVLPTGSTIGPMSSIASYGPIEKHTKGFGWITGNGREDYQMDKALDAAKQIRKIKNKTFNKNERAFFEVVKRLNDQYDS